MKQLSLYIVLALLGITSACSSSAPVHDRTVGNWLVMTTASDKSSRLCYAATGPVKSASSVEKRAQAYLMVTRRTSGKIEVSVSSGYIYKPHSAVKLAIDAQGYKLFSKGDVAWARSDAEDKTIIKALKTAAHIEVRGTSEDGGTSTDSYTSAGFAQALARVRELCP